MKNSFILSLAILFLLFSIVLSLSFLKGVQFQTTLTGKASTQSTGQIDLNLTDVLSITVNDTSINFGACTINTTKNYSLYDSSQGQTTGDNVLCSNSSLPDKLIVENDGTVRLNVSTKIHEIASSAFNDSQAWVAFKVINNSARPGCVGDLQTTYYNYTQANTPYPLCTKLGAFDSNDRLDFFVEVYVTNQSSGSLNTTVEFTGVALH